MLNSNKILLRNFSSLSIYQISGYIFPLITFPYLLRILGAGNYGLMNFAAAFAAYFHILIDFGFNFTAPRDISINKDDKEKINGIFSVVLSLKIIFFVISVIIFSALVFSIPKFFIQKEIYLLSFIAVFGEMLFPAWFFFGMQAMHYISLISVSIRAAAVILIFLFIKQADDLPLLIFINGISLVLTGAAGLYIAVSKFKLKYKFPGLTALRFQFKDSLHLFISTVSINLYTSTNVLLLGFLAGDVYVGYYAAADKIRLAVTNLCYPVTQTIYPRLAELFNSSFTDGVNLLRKVLKSGGAVILIACILIFIYADEIIYLAAGENYKASIPVLRIISFLPFIIFLINLSGIQTMLNLGYKEAFMKIIIAAAAISLVLSIFLVPVYKHIGTSITLLITELFVTSAAVAFVVNLMRSKMIKKLISEQ